MSYKNPFRTIALPIFPLGSYTTLKRSSPAYHTNGAVCPHCTPIATILSVNSKVPLALYIQQTEPDWICQTTMLEIKNDQLHTTQDL